MLSVDDTAQHEISERSSINSIRDVAVVIPAADEQDGIEYSLAAVMAACRHLRRRRALSRVAVQVIVVLDDCRDATADIVARYPDVSAVTATARNVGAARRLGTDYALEHASQPGSLWLANTDADSRVPTDWLSYMVDRADRGVDFILGTVMPGPGLSPQARRAWFELHHLHDGHPHIHGANLGIRASTYLTIGGWHPLSTGEDRHLVKQADHHQVNIERSAATPVLTSTRVVGRAPGGFSDYLRDLTPTT